MINLRIPNPRRPRLAIAMEYGIEFQGGVTVPCRVLIAQLADRFEIILVSPDSTQDAHDSSVGRHLSGHIQWNPGRRNRQVSRQLSQELSRHRVDLAHFHFGGNFGFSGDRAGYSPIPFAARAGITVFTTVHMVVDLLDGYCGPQRSQGVKWLLLPLAWRAKMEVLKHVRAEMVTSKRGFHLLRKWYWPLRSRFRLTYQSRLSEADVPVSGNSRDRMILYAGHLASRKGQLVLAEAFSRVAPQSPDWRLELRGTVVEPGIDLKLANAIKKWNLDQRILLPGSHPNAPELMRQAAIYVQPSYFEGLPLGLQEAMFSGCACVATDIPGNNELIENERTGILVPAGNVEAMASALQRLIDDEELRLRLAKAGQGSVIARGMTAQRMLAAYNQLYDEALRAR